MRTAQTASREAGTSPAARPGYLRVGWATFVGYLGAVVLLIPIGIGVSFLGIDALGLSDSAGRGVFYRSDVWSFLAEACVGILVTGVTAFLVGDQLRRGTGWDAPFGFTFLTLLLTGYAPVAALTPLYGATALASLAVATVVLRWRCEPAGAKPANVLGGVPRRHRRSVAIAIAIAVPTMAAYALAYGATHPVRWDASVAFSPNGTAIGGGGSSPHYPRDAGAIERYVFPVKNLGLFAVGDLALNGIEGSPVFQLERIGIVGDGESSGGRGALTPLSDLELAARETRYLVVEFRQGRECAQASAQLDAVRLRFGVLGGTFDERVPLVDKPTIRC